jgi:hypothetical protein
LTAWDLEAATIAGHRRTFALHVNPAIGAVRLDKGRLSTLLAKL